jgi:hypothetical protein
MRYLSQRCCVLPKWWNSYNGLYGVTFQKTVTCTVTAFWSLDAIYAEFVSSYWSYPFRTWKGTHSFSNRGRPTKLLGVLVYSVDSSDWILNTASPQELINFRWSVYKNKHNCYTLTTPIFYLIMQHVSAVRPTSRTPSQKYRTKSEITPKEASPLQVSLRNE